MARFWGHSEVPAGSLGKGLDGLPPATLRLFGCRGGRLGWESAAALGVMPGEGRVLGELGKSGSAFLVALSFHGLCRRSDKPTELGGRGRRVTGSQAGCSWQPCLLPAPCLYRQSTPCPPWGYKHRASRSHRRGQERRGGTGTPHGGGLEPLAPQPGSNPCSVPAGFPRPRPEHPTVRKGEAGALQRCLEQPFRSSSASPRSFGATKAPQISNPTANIFI